MIALIFDVCDSVLLFHKIVGIRHDAVLIEMLLEDFIHRLLYGGSELLSKYLVLIFKENKCLYTDKLLIAIKYLHLYLK